MLKKYLHIFTPLNFKIFILHFYTFRFCYLNQLSKNKIEPKLDFSKEFLNTEL